MNRLSRRLPSQPLRPNTSTISSRRRRSSGAGLVVLCAFIYGLVGFLVTALPPVPWLWPLVLVALGLHLWAISLVVVGDRGWSARLGSGLLQLLAALGLVLPLAVSLNFLGSDQIDDITIGSTLGQVVMLSLGAVVVALLGRWATTQLGHHLIRRLSLRQMRGVLALVGILGLTLGGAAGMLLPVG